MSKSLAIKYRPAKFADLTEQSAVVSILTNQIETNTIKHGYLFCGGAGTGKTTSARIFANMINKGMGEPIELDAASNNSVEDIRRLCEQSQKKSMDSEYKVFVIDECHSLSNQAWQAFLKTLEEPPAKSIFILCTTNPEKIPQTILSRVQRYNFQRISQQGIVDRLIDILSMEEYYCSDGKYSELTNKLYDLDAIEYIAKVADGGMRDAITLMDKCISYNETLTVQNVVEALGIADYETMFQLLDSFIMLDSIEMMKIVDNVYSSGMDLKLFAKTFFEFILDMNVFCVLNSLDVTKIPNTYKSKIDNYREGEWEQIKNLLKFANDLHYSLKWEQNPKSVIIAKSIIYMEEQ